MKKILNNPLIAVLLLLTSIVYIVITYRLRTEWWMSIDMFFAFMATFCHLMATLFAKMIPAERKRMDRIALIMLTFMAISAIAELIAAYLI